MEAARDRCGGSAEPIIERRTQPQTRPSAPNGNPASAARGNSRLPYFHVWFSLAA